MMRIADIIEANLEDFAWAESKDQGKPIHVAKSVDIPRCIHNFRFFATAILHSTNSSVVQEEPIRALNYVVRTPIGVAGLISPWNLPLYLLSFKIAPAIAAGNTVVAKPSEFTSITACLLARVFLESGLPPGVVNIVFGYGGSAGQHLVSSPRLSLISFTGSTITGRKIAEIAAKHNKKVSLEMGGKNACIIFEDADLDKHLPVILRSAFANQSEICLCSSRFFVQETIFDSFLKRFVERAKALKVGDPADPASDLGPLVSREHLSKVAGYLEKVGNGKVLCGLNERGQRLKPHLPDQLMEGYYFVPTVISNVSDHSELMQEEIFGPIVCMVPFETEEEVIERANDVKYGLSASVYSQDVGRVHRVAQGLNVGTVWSNCWLVRELNMPFGGTKASGVGREGAEESLDFFTEKKNIVVNLS